MKDRLIPLGLECQALRPTDFAQQNGFIDQEFIFDFTGSFYGSDEDHFLIQTAVAGESEWDKGATKEWWDFHKLLQSDALLCFMMFELYPERIKSCFEHLSCAIVRKQQNRREHSLSVSAYLLSCRWNYPNEYEFKHQFIDTDSSIIDL